MSIGLWPCSLQRVDTVVDGRMLREWSAMQRRVPTCSLTGWLEVEADKGIDYGLATTVSC